MRVLLQARHDLDEVFGGDTVHVRELLAQLRHRGVDASLSLDTNPDLGRVDIVHLFNAVRVTETFIQFTNAARQGVAAVCTPIYVPRHRIRRYEEHAWTGAAGLARLALPSFECRQQLKSWLREMAVEDRSELGARLAVRYREKQRRVLSGVSRVFVDTQLEAAAIHHDLGLRELPITCIPLSPELPVPSHPAPAPCLDKRPFVLHAARVEPLKNQLALLDALKGTDLSVCFCGPANPRHGSYVSRFRDRVGRSTGAHYLGFVSRQQMAQLYDAARVVALPSWLEAAGLAALEGAARARPVVVTTESYAREYLGDRAEYCDPGDLSSIRRAVLAACDRTMEGWYGGRIGSPTWSAHAELTVQAYNAVLEGRPLNPEL